jgi:hypothetical protein
MEQGGCNMNSTIRALHRTDITPRIRAIQAAWSPQERRARAEFGRRKIREFLDLLAASSPDNEIWAVGAPSGDDVPRLVG